VSGWGYTEKKKIGTPFRPWLKAEYLQVVDIDIVPHEECVQKFASFDVNSAFEEKQSEETLEKYKNNFPIPTNTVVCAYGKEKGRLCFRSLKIRP